MARSRGLRAGVLRPEGGQRDALLPLHPARDRFRARYQQATDRIRNWQQYKREAEEAGDREGMHRANHQLQEAGEARDALHLFRKNLQSFVRVYDFLSQVIDYDDREQLCVFARHLHPLLRIERLEEDDIDLSELQLTHYRLTKRAEHDIRLGEEEGERTPDPVSEVDSAKPKDPKKERLDRIIERINDLSGAEIDDRDQLNFARNLAGRVSRGPEIAQQAQTHTEDEIMHGGYPKALEKILLDATNDNEQLASKALETDEVVRPAEERLTRDRRHLENMQQRRARRRVA